MAKKPYYITTAIAYTSGKPHIGNTYEAILSDAIARFKRSQGYDVTEAVPVYSIVNSLTGLPGISRVQILINGETDLVYRESIRFDTIFERNLDLVEEE